MVVAVAVHQAPRREVVFKLRNTLIQPFYVHFELSNVRRLTVPRLPRSYPVPFLSHILGYPRGSFLVL